MRAPKAALAALAVVAGLVALVGFVRRPAQAANPPAEPAQASVPDSEVHPDRLEMIRKIRNMRGVLWKAGASPRFARQAPGASKDQLGIIGDQKKIIAEHIRKGDIEQAAPIVGAARELPVKFDTAENWPLCNKVITEIRDQSNCGCCWAFAGSSAASDRLCINTGGKVQVPLSAQDACFNGGMDVSFGCNGGQLSSTFLYLQKNAWSIIGHNHGLVTGGLYHGDGPTGPFGEGMCSDFSMPHCHHHGPQGADPYPNERDPKCPEEETPRGPTACDSTAEGEHTNFHDDKHWFKGKIVSASGEHAMMMELMNGGSMSVAFIVYEDFEAYVEGIYHHVLLEQKELGGHAVRLVGFGKSTGEDGVENPYWKIANSWNMWWGEKGHFRMLRGVNECGIEDQAVAPRADVEWGRNGGLDKDFVTKDFVM